MKKHIIAIGIIFVLLLVGFSGCIFDRDTSYEEDKDVVYDEELSIEYFIVEPGLVDLGDSAYLSWKVLGAKSVSIDNSIGNVGLEGKQIIFPTENTTYTITALDSEGSAEAFVKVYVSGMIGTSPETTPNMQFVKDDTHNKLTVASADPGNLQWSDFEMTNSSGSAWQNNSGAVQAGQYIEVSSGTATVNIRHISTNTLIGTWNFN